MTNYMDEDIPEEYYELAEEYEKLYPEITDADIEREIEALQWQKTLIILKGTWKR